MMMYLYIPYIILIHLYTTYIYMCVSLDNEDPMELYRDAMAHGTWAIKAMRELGFPNTYTFAKARERSWLGHLDAIDMHISKHIQGKFNISL